jgi:hypothetical protein
MGVEGVAELGPWHLVVYGASSGVVGPPCGGVSMQLLRGEESLLQIRAV